MYKYIHIHTCIRIFPVQSANCIFHSAGACRTASSVPVKLQNVVLPKLCNEIEAIFVEKTFFFQSGAPDPEVSAEFLQRPSLLHPASAESAGQKF